MKKLIPLILLLSLSGCGAIQKEQAKTVLDLARNACALYATQAGLTVKDVCETEEQLRPFIDSILAGHAAAAAQRAGTCNAAAHAPEKKGE